MTKPQAFLKDRKWREADKVADELLRLMNGERPGDAKTAASTVQRRLPAKIQRIQQELPAWIQNTGDKDKAVALMRKLGEHRKVVNLDEAEKTADAILKMLGATAPDKPAETDR
jgi:hypothetical protein